MEDYIVGKYSEVAFKLATQLHKGQFRWDKKTPYIEHPKAVAIDAIKMGKALGFTEEKLDIVSAISALHDSCEDCDITIEELRSLEFSPDIIEGVEYMTHDKSKTEYIDYIVAIKEASNPYPRIVKLCDLGQNLINLHKGSMRDKYLMAKYILES